MTALAPNADSIKHRQIVCKNFFIMRKYGEVTLGQIEALINKIGGIEGLKKLLSGESLELKPIDGWVEENGIIYFSVTSHGMTGEEWISFFEESHIYLIDYVKEILLSKKFKPTDDTTYRVAIMRGDRFFTDEKRTSLRVYLKGKKLKFSFLPIEVVCLIMAKFNRQQLEAMNLFRVSVMHKLLRTTNYGFQRLGISILDWPFHSLISEYPGILGKWEKGTGFAFAAPSNLKL